jgi:hypothetical protein
MKCASEIAVFIPSAADGRNQIPDMGDGCALSAVSLQHSAFTHERKSAWFWKGCKTSSQNAKKS